MKPSEEQLQSFARLCIDARVTPVVLQKPDGAVIQCRIIIKDADNKDVFIIFEEPIEDGDEPQQLISHVVMRAYYLAIESIKPQPRSTAP